MYDALRELMKEDFTRERNAGMQANSQEIATRMIQKRMAYDLIVDLTKLPLSKVQEISDSLHIPLTKPADSRSHLSEVPQGN